jgi:hypothetical protein
MTFDNYRKAEYPDFCCNYETYTNHLFLECELLGELKSYAPGESAVIREKWAIIKNKDLDESERKDG